MNVILLESTESGFLCFGFIGKSGNTLAELYICNVLS